MEEIFKEVYIENYGYIKVNNLGTKMFNKLGKELAHRKDSYGYVFCRVQYTKEGIGHSIMLRMHRMVAKAFIPNINNYPEINHIDANKENNCVDNIEWCTRQQNIDHATKNNLMPHNSGSKNGRAILSECDIVTIRKLFKEGMSVYRIAKIYNRGWTTINHIIKNETWKCVN